MVLLGFVIPAHAGIQVCFRRISLDTRYRGYDGTQAAVRSADQPSAHSFSKEALEFAESYLFT